MKTITGNYLSLAEREILFFYKCQDGMNKIIMIKNKAKTKDKPKTGSNKQEPEN